MNFLFKTLLAAFIALCIDIALYFFLPHRGIEPILHFTTPLFESYHLSSAFGLVAQKERKRAKPLYSLQNIKLKAIYSSGKGGVIGIEDKKKIRFLSVGDVFKGYKLIQVLPDRAIFERNGKQYEVKLKESKPKGSLKYEEVFTKMPAYFIVPKKRLSYYKKNFDAIWKDIAIKEEYGQNHHLKGYRVQWVRRGSVFDKIGLKKGDLITMVNDERLTSNAQAFRIYKNIDKYDALKITIVRNGEEKDLEYEVR